MIYSVTANKDSFHNVRFEAGLNLIVAERSRQASSTDSRNGLGKTTLFQIIDFCLGAKSKDKENLPIEYLPEWEFTVDLDIRGRRVKVMRETDNPEVVHITGDISGWNIRPESVGDAVSHVPLTEWQRFLGWAFFDIPQPGEGAPACKTPSPRTLIAFFIRRRYEDALLPTRAPGIDDLAIAYLLGLNWDYLSRLEELKTSEKNANTEKSAAELDLERWEKTETALRSECNELETEMNQIKAELDNFRIPSAYEEIKRSIEELTKELHAVEKRAVRAQNRLNTANNQLRRVQASMLPVEELYAECGLVFPDAVKETLANVKQFHDAVTGSRRVILEREVRSLEQAVSALEDKSRRLSEERSSAMQILDGEHALDEFISLNQRYTEKARELQHKMDCLVHLRNSKNALKQIREEKKSIAADARTEFENLRPTWIESENFFNELTRKFYRRPGSLNIQISGAGKKYGFKFDPRVESDNSEGIKKIKVFSFDMTLFHQQRVCEHPIDFIIHDSKIYDSTDPRQVVTALREADRISRELGGQYICAINSDKLHEEEFTAEMSLEESRAFTRLTLSDESDATKLLGIPFGRETEIPVAIQNQRTVDDVIASADAPSEASQGEEPQPPAE